MTFFHMWVYDHPIQAFVNTVVLCMLLAGFVSTGIKKR
jgi:hypothetical protein